MSATFGTLTVSESINDNVFYKVKKSGPGLVKKAVVVAEELGGTAVCKVVTNRLRKFAEDLKSIDTDFTTIGTVLAAIDKKDLVKDGQGAAYPFHPRWKKLFRDYTEILVKSLTSGTHVKASIQSLLAVVVKTVGDPNLSLQEKQKVILDFKKGLTTYVGDESKTVEDLRNLSYDMVTFKADLVSRLEDQSAAAGENIKDLETRIEQLRQELVEEDSKGIIRRIIDAFKRALDDQPADAAGMTGLVSLGGKAVNNFFGRKKEKQRQLGQLQQELRDEKSSLEHISGVLEAVRAIEKDFMSLLSRIGLLTEINQLLLMSAGGLERALDKMGTAQGQAIFKGFLSLLKTAFAFFDECATAYTQLAERSNSQE